MGLGSFSLEKLQLWSNLLVTIPHWKQAWRWITELKAYSPPVYLHLPPIPLPCVPSAKTRGDIKGQQAGHMTSAHQRIHLARLTFESSNTMVVVAPNASLGLDKGCQGGHCRVLHQAPNNLVPVLAQGGIQGSPFPNTATAQIHHIGFNFKWRLIPGSSQYLPKTLTTTHAVCLRPTDTVWRNGELFELRERERGVPGRILENLL